MSLYFVKEKKKSKKFFLSCLNPFRALLLGLFLTTLCLSVNNSLMPYALKNLLNSFLFISFDSDARELLWPILFYIFTSLFLVLVYRLHNFFWFCFSPALKLHISKLCVYSSMSHPYESFQNYPPVKVANTIKEMALSLPELVRSIFDGLFYGALSLLVAVITVSKVSYKFGLGLFAWIAIYVVGSIIILKFTKKLAKKGIQISSKMLSKTAEILSNIKCIRLFTCEFIEVDKLKKILGEGFVIDRKKEQLFMKETAFQGISFLCYQCICISWLFNGVKHGITSAGDFALILTINIQFTGHFRKISKELVKFADNLGIIQKGLDIIKFEYPFSHTLHLNSHSSSIVSGEIVFQGVNFHYNGCSPLFVDATIYISTGERIAIIGPSGSGKTTFINLLLRLYDVQSGAIFVGGHNINKISYWALRRAISVVPQEPFLFSGTIIENIACGNNFVSEQEIVNAAKNAEIHDFISTLPDKYYTSIDPTHLKFSIGQYQRIALARAFVKNAPILILDEAMSHIDVITATRIENSLLKITKEKTSIIITHHLSDQLARSVNRILYFDNGIIGEMT